MHWLSVMVQAVAHCQSVLQAGFPSHVVTWLAQFARTQATHIWQLAPEPPAVPVLPAPPPRPAAPPPPPVAFVPPAPAVPAPPPADPAVPLDPASLPELLSPQATNTSEKEDRTRAAAHFEALRMGAQ
jgi:hypothetical protein